MAAHALTISKQIVAEPDESVVRYVGMSLAAPGWDTLPWDRSMDLYCDLSDAVKAGDPDGVREAARACELACGYLDRFRSMEEARSAMASEVRFGKPHHRKRLAKFFAVAVTRREGELARVTLTL